MRLSGIIHQQICQLKWHLLACLGLIMVLPIEEAVVNLRAGDGFFTATMIFPAVFFGPLLAGLIACANVQGDLNEKHYIFWRSKPANVKLLITIKFFTGLIASLIILACPVVFTFVSNIIWNEEGIETVFIEHYLPLLIMIAIMTYSLCFACNVVVRKTARAWLIGMLTGCFLLVLPFMLPLDIKDFVSDVMLWSWGPYLTIMLVTPAAAFTFALYAAKHDWHLKTNLKGLLWVGAGLAFLLLMLFSSQVANIKVLDEKEIKERRWPTLNYAGSRIIFQGHSYIEDDKDAISFHKIGSGNVVPNIYGNIGIDSEGRRIHYGPRMADYHDNMYPRFGRFLYKDTGNEMFSFSIHAYYRREGSGSTWKNFYEKVYLRSYQHTGKSWMPVCELDISYSLTNTVNSIRLAMRMIDNRLVACVNDSIIVVDATAPKELKLIDKKIDVLPQYWPCIDKDRKEEFDIPLVPVEDIELQERIKLSIDLNYRFHYGSNNIYEASIVDINDGKIAFVYLEYDEVIRYDVTSWDDEQVYCRFSTSRPYTILEVATGTPSRPSPKFVKNGKLYCYTNSTLLVFDIRSNRGIRKLGHFVRMDYDIEDIAVLEDGNIVLCVRWRPEFIRNRSIKRRSKEDKYYLYLLKNPE